MRRKYYRQVSLAERRDKVLLIDSLRKDDISSLTKYYLVIFDNAGYLSQIVCYRNNKPDMAYVFSNKGNLVTVRYFGVRVTSSQIGIIDEIFDYSLKRMLRYRAYYLPSFKLIKREVYDNGTLKYIEYYNINNASLFCREVFAASNNLAKVEYYHTVGVKVYEEIYK